MAQKFDTIEEYLKYVGRCRQSDFGKRFRSQFQNTQGTAELAMLAAPSEEEYSQFCRVVETLTPDETKNLEKLTDEQIQRIAKRAEADAGNVGIFINGYVLAQKKGDY